jgi:hypothetical protein
MCAILSSVLRLGEANSHNWLVDRLVRLLQSVGMIDHHPTRLEDCLVIPTAYVCECKCVRDVRGVREVRMKMRVKSYTLIFIASEEERLNSLLKS